MEYEQAAVARGPAPQPQVSLELAKRLPAVVAGDCGVHERSTLEIVKMSFSTTFRYSEACTAAADPRDRPPPSSTWRRQKVRPSNARTAPSARSRARPPWSPRKVAGQECELQGPDRHQSTRGFFLRDGFRPAVESPAKSARLQVNISFVLDVYNDFGAIWQEAADTKRRRWRRKF